MSSAAPLSVVLSLFSQREKEGAADVIFEMITKIIRQMEKLELSV